MNESGSVPDTVVAVFRLPMEGVALSDAARQAPELYFRLEQVALCDTANGVPVWIGGYGRERLEAALESDSSLDAFTYLYRNDDELLYELTFESEQQCLQQFIFEYGGSILNAHGDDGTWTLTVRFPSRDDLSDAYDAMTEFDTNVDIDKIKTNPSAVHRPELSDAQYEALVSALEQGYFEVPRRVTLEELAAELDISHQAASERLRRAQKRVCSSIFHRSSPDVDERDDVQNERDDVQNERGPA